MTALQHIGPIFVAVVLLVGTHSQELLADELSAKDKEEVLEVARVFMTALKNRDRSTAVSYMPTALRDYLTVSNFNTLLPQVQILEGAATLGDVHQRGDLAAVVLRVKTEGGRWRGNFFLDCSTAGGITYLYEAEIHPAEVVYSDDGHLFIHLFMRRHDGWRVVGMWVSSPSRNEKSLKAYYYDKGNTRVRRVAVSSKQQNVSEIRF